MGIAIITGALGLVGAAAVRKFHHLGLDVIGVDNDQRRVLFGADASNAVTQSALLRDCPGYQHRSIDIRDENEINALVQRAGKDLVVVVHAAAQPSHDWAATDPKTDFAINATATLSLLDACRLHAPETVFLFTSTNKVYGDLPNKLPLTEKATRIELQADHPFHREGIDESMSIDQSNHSLFGVSKASADLMVQEYASRFGMHTVVFRAGCITGEDHNGAKAHGFLSYLCKSALTGIPYEVIGNKGKQVRDNLHADDLAEAFVRAVQSNGPAGVYNMGGGRQASVSVIEALELVAELLARPVEHYHTDQPRYGDHIWWISDTRSFQRAYPGWRPQNSARDLIERLLF